MHTKSSRTDSTWPVLTSYDSRHLNRICLPIGGIGTGTIGLGGRGDLRDFQVANRPAHGFGPHVAFTAVRVASDAGPTATLVAEGPLPEEAYEGPYGSPVPLAGLPRFTTARFDACYPLGQVTLSSPHTDALGVRVRIEAFNPFVPCDVAASSWPIAVLRYVIANDSATPVRASVCLSLSNVIGADGTANLCGGNVNEARSDGDVHGVVLRAPELDLLDPPPSAAGEIAIATQQMADRHITSRTHWADAAWNGDVLDFWDDFSSDGELGEPDTVGDGGEGRPVASLCVKMTVPAGGCESVQYVLAWNFPHRRAWSAGVLGAQAPTYQDDIVVGNHYSTVHPVAWQTASAAIRELPHLERRTIEAVRAIAATDAPHAVTEGALNNISTLRSQTVFRTADGRFFGWEGVGDHSGSCHGTCNHVWGYEFATSYLFPDIAWSMRDTQFCHATDDEGRMSFRVGLPLAANARTWQLAAADGQMASLVHLYADWRLTGDDNALRRLWPGAKRALEFCWIPGGWDADSDGVMEGCQHNTMDVEYYGPNPQMTGWYLAALRAMARLADHLDEPEFASHCADLADRGGTWMDANLFTGEYYRHEVRPPASVADIAPGLRHPFLGAADVSRPDLQLENGCLIDQLVGDHAAVLVGLGHVVSADNVATALDTIVARGTLDPAGAAVNNMRCFVLGDERAVVMATYPPGERPARPFPYYAEVMTGFEYTAALGLVQAGRYATASRVVTDIRSRYDGAKRNPFDEAECGHHYARALASWNVLVAWTGLEYDAVTGVLHLAAPAPGRTSFWSVGTGWGTVATEENTVRVTVIEGHLRLSAVWIDGCGGPLPDRIEAGAGWSTVVTVGHGVEPTRRSSEPPTPDASRSQARRSSATAPQPPE